MTQTEKNLLNMFFRKLCKLKSKWPWDKKKKRFIRYVYMGDIMNEIGNICAVLERRVVPNNDKYALGAQVSGRNAAKASKEG